MIEPRNDEFAGAETVVMVERNMCNAVMRGIAVPPGSKSTSRVKGSHRKLGGLASGRQMLREAAATPNTKRTQRLRGVWE